MTSIDKDQEEKKFGKWLASFASSFAGHCTDEAIFMAKEAWMVCASEHTPQPDQVPAQPALNNLLEMIKTWVETESGPKMKVSLPDLKAQVTIKGYKKIILERTFKENI